MRLQNMILPQRRKQIPLRRKQMPSRRQKPLHRRKRKLLRENAQKRLQRANRSLPDRSGSSLPSAGRSPRAEDPRTVRKTRRARTCPIRGRQCREDLRTRPSREGLRARQCREDRRVRRRREGLRDRIRREGHRAREGNRCSIRMTRHSPE